MKKFFQEGIFQFLVILVLSWLIISFVPTELFFTKYLPWSFSLLFWLVILAVVGRSWPGSSLAKKSPVSAGLLSTTVWIAFALATTWIIMTVWPAVPLFPVNIFFGIILFTVTLWYAFVWGAYPFEKLPAVANVFIGAVIVFAITAGLWSFLVDFKGTPWEDAAFNPSGLYSPDFVFGLMVWTIAWMLILAFSLQCYPFYKLGKPWGQLVVTALFIVLGYFTWTISIEYMEPTFSIAIGGSIVGWALFQSTLLAYYPFTKYTQPKRGIFSLIVIAVAVAIWIPLFNFILEPVYTNVKASEIPFDLSQIVVIYTLHIIPILALAHSFFWSRIPFQPPGPPIGPEEIIKEESDPDHDKVENF